ncbi:MAG: hypothetical protein DME37_12820 [Verrucomicrobia bacterium]|nr:MAG: hypothetical protein DME37_12820 [Verrucomicrobiota bacterium]
MEGLTTIPSRFGPKETMDRLVAEINAKGMNVFARIDHAAGAAEVGLTLRPTELIIFGNARGGTPLMQSVQTVGIDLPLKVLVWQDAESKTWLSYNEPSWIAQRHGIINSQPVSGLVLGISALTLGIGLLRAGVQSETLANSSQPTADPDWSELIATMDKMHTAMGAIERSGNADVDFVRLMLPHHQAAIDMAKTQLLYGKDPQMRRLAQEIVTDQQLEIELMRRWLKQRELASAKDNKTSAPDSGKENQK